MTQRASFGNDDQLLLDSMADEDAYYQGMHRRGSFIGAGTDLFGKALDYHSRMSGANLLANLAKKRERRAQDLIDTAGAGAEERIEAARSAKIAATRDALKSAADKAAMDTTGAGVIDFAQKSAEIQRDSADTGLEETREQRAALEQKALGLKHKADAEDMALQAKHDKQRARLQGVKDIVFGAAELAANLQPQSYEARKQSKAMRQTKKGFRSGRGGLKTVGRGAQSQIAGTESKLAAQEAGLDQKTALRLERKGERQIQRGRRQMQRGMQRIDKGTRHFDKASEASEDLQRARDKKLAKQRRLYGNTLASSFTPGTAITQGNE